MVDVAFVVVALVKVALVANRFVIVESVDVRVSITPVVKWPTVENRLELVALPAVSVCDVSEVTNALVEVALVVEELVENKLVVVALANAADCAERTPIVVEVEYRFVEVALVNTAFVAEKVLVVLVRLRLPPMPTSPDTFALLAVRLSTVVEAEVRTPRVVVPEAERSVAPIEVPEMEPPVKVELEIDTALSWPIELVWAITWYVSTA